eukprot:2661755-Rhodomonas_salina.1
METASVNGAMLKGHDKGFLCRAIMGRWTACSVYQKRPWTPGPSPFGPHLLKRRLKTSRVSRPHHLPDS